VVDIERELGNRHPREKRELAVKGGDQQGVASHGPGRRRYVSSWFLLRQSIVSA
jgi:hypothetical protein